MALVDKKQLYLTHSHIEVEWTLLRATFLFFLGPDPLL